MMSTVSQPTRRNSELLENYEGKPRESLPSRNLLDLIALGSDLVIRLYGKSSSEASSAKKGDKSFSFTTIPGRILTKSSPRTGSTELEKEHEKQLHSLTKISEFG